MKNLKIFLKKSIEERYHLHIIGGAILQFVILLFSDFLSLDFSSLRLIEFLLVCTLFGIFIGYLFEWLQRNFSGRNIQKGIFKILDKLKIISQTNKSRLSHGDAITTGIGFLIGALIHTLF